MGETTQKAPRKLPMPWRPTVAIAVVIMVAGYAAREWYAAQQLPDALGQHRAAEEVLREAQEKLDSWAEAQPDGAPFLPPDTEWTPKGLPCGGKATATPDEAKAPAWVALGIGWEGQTHQQARFRALSPSSFELLLRSDNDCDGLFQVHRLIGFASSSGVSEARITVDNPGE